MKEYRNLGNDSGILGYESRSDFIRVEFSNGSVYLYTYASAGKNNIEEIKQLATDGQGLNSFINRNVRLKYAEKER